MKTIRHIIFEALQASNPINNKHILDNVPKEIDKYYSSFNKDRWIPVQESLPGFDELVLWVTESGYQFTNALDKDDNIYEYLENDILSGRITHWRKLPEYPQ